MHSEKRVESDTALVNRIIGREAGGKQNILVMNDEAHHAYRIKRRVDEDDQTPFSRTSLKMRKRPRTSSRKPRSGSTAWIASRSFGESTSASTCRRRRTFSGASARRLTGRFRGS